MPKALMTDLVLQIIFGPYLFFETTRLQQLSVSVFAPSNSTISYHLIHQPSRMRHWLQATNMRHVPLRVKLERIQSRVGRTLHVHPDREQKAQDVTSFKTRC